jgi:ABC-2 type transport system permease protein
MTAVAGPATPAGAGTNLTGIRELMRLAARRDRIMAAVWCYVIAGLVASSTISFRKLYPHAADLSQAADTANRVGGELLLYGRDYAPSTLGGMVAWRSLLFGGALLGVLALLLVVRHTRAEEESGRRELVSAGVVGRQAPLAAGVAWACAVSLIAGLVGAVASVATKLPASGSFALGLALAGSGCVFAGVAAVAAQLTQSARAARGITAIALAAAYLVRGVADTATGLHWLTWLSPLGWAEQVRAFGAQRWWVLGLLLLGTVLPCAVAGRLSARRDLGAGLLATRPGPARANRWLRGALGLAWRLQRGVLAGWTVGVAATGAIIGAVATGIVNQLGSKQAEKLLQRLGGHQNITDSFLAAELTVLALLAGVFVVQAVLRPRGEETTGRAEPVLAGSVSRLRWLGGHALIAALGAIWLLVIGGLATGVAYGLTVHQLGRQTGRLTGAALAQAPAVLVIAAAALAIVGLRPRIATAAAWSVLGSCLLISEFGPALRLSHWVLDISPFTHAAGLPGHPLAVVALLWLLGVATIGTAVALISFRRRDIG